MGISTKKGDSGYTSLLRGEQVPKHHLIIEAGGSLDEANSLLGLARAASTEKRIKRIILQVQKHLFTMGAEFSVSKGGRNSSKKRISEQDVKWLEGLVEEFEESLALPPGFVAFRQNEDSSHLDVERTSVRKASRELKDLVDEHATILSRERDLVELALQVQAVELEKIFTDQNLLPDGTNTNVYVSSDRSPIEAEPGKPKLLRPMGMMGSRPHEVSYGKQTYWIPENLDKADSNEIINRLSRILPVYRSLAQKYPALIFWQLTAFENGASAIYPAIQKIPMMHKKLQANWYQLAKDRKQIAWSKPAIDPITNQIVHGNLCA